jgi:hypothetical protein
MFQIRIIVSIASNQSRASKLDLMAVRMAAINQILDPWVYILLRRSLITGTIRIIKTVLCYPKTVVTNTFRSQTQTDRQCCVGGRYCETSLQSSQRGYHMRGRRSLCSPHSQNSQKQRHLYSWSSKRLNQNEIKETQPKLQVLNVNNKVVTSVYRQDDLQITNIQLPPITDVPSQEGSELTNKQRSSPNDILPEDTASGAVSSSDYPSVCVIEAELDSDVFLQTGNQSPWSRDSFLQAGNQSPWSRDRESTDSHRGKKSIFSSFKRLNLWTDSRWPDDNSFFSLPDTIGEKKQ